MNHWLRVAFAALSAAALIGARAEDVDVEVDAPGVDEHVSDTAIVEEIAAGDYVKKHPHFATHVLFTTTANRTEFVAGERVDLLVAVENKSQKPLALRGIQASIRMPQQWDFHIQNFTGEVITEVIPPGQEGAIQYAFVPHESFDSRDYGLTVLVDYELDNVAYRGDVFNSTFTIYEQQQVVDIQAIFMIVVTVGCAVAIGFGLQNALGGAKSSKKRLRANPSAPVERGTVKKADPSWLEGTSVGGKRKN